MGNNIDMHPFPTRQMIEGATKEMALYWLSTLPRPRNDEERLIVYEIYERHVALSLGGDKDWRVKYKRLTRIQDLVLPVLTLILALMVLLPPAPC